MRLWAIRTIWITALLPACSPEPVRAPGEVAIEALESFDDAFVATDSVVLRQSDDALVATVAAVAFERDRIAIADLQQQHISVWNRSGMFVQTIGRGGQGPGEFIAPSGLAFGADRNLHVLDRGARRISVFDHDGALLRTTALDQLGLPGDFVPRADGSYLVLVMDPANPAALVHVSADGAVLWRGLPIGAEVADGETDGPLWEPARLLTMSVRDDTVFAVTTLRSTLWRTVPGTDRVQRTDLTFPGYLPVVLPEPGRGQVQGMAYLAERHMNVFPLTTDTELYWTFVQGNPFGDDAARILIRVDTARAWSGYTDAPFIVATSGDQLVVAREPGTDDTRFVLYRPTRQGGR